MGSVSFVSGRHLRLDGPKRDDKLIGIEHSSHAGIGDCKQVN